MESKPRHDHEEVEIPTDVVEFAQRLSQNLLTKDVDALNTMYEVEVPRLTDQYFSPPPMTSHRGPRQAGKHWPTMRAMRKLLGNNNVVEQVYGTVYFRSAYGDRQVGAHIRKAAWESYSNLLTALVDGDAIDLPNGWIFDIIDEFIYQLTVHRIRRLRPEQALAPEVWSVQGAFARLEAVVERSGIRDLLSAIETQNEDPAKVTSPGRDHVRRVLGYCALVGIVKLHTLLGDYTAALQAATPLGVRSFGPTISKAIPSLHTSLHYHAGFAYLMYRRYADADHTLQQALLVKAVKARKYLEQQQVQVVSLLLICGTLGDLVIQDYSALVHDRNRSNQDDDANLLAQGDLERFKDLFVRACPKFITASDADNNALSETGQEAKDLQLKVFLRGVDQRINVLKLRGYLSAYSTLKHEKVGSLLGEGAVEASLVAMKLGARQIVRAPGGTLIHGQEKRCGIVDFTSQNDSLTVQRHSEQPTVAAAFFDRLNQLNLKAAVAK